MRILITGANGYIGYHTGKALKHHDCKVLATGRGENAHPEIFDAYQIMDLTSQEQVENTIFNFQPDVILHAGAISAVDYCEQNRHEAYAVNVEGTKHLLACAEACQSLFVFLSTSFVFGGIMGNYRENDVREPVNYYGETKKLAEDEVLKYPYSAIIRTVLVYGPSLKGKQNFLTRTLYELKEQKQLKIFSDQLRNPTYISDLVEATVKVITNKIPGVFHISGKDQVSPFEFACEAARQSGLDVNLIEPVIKGAWKEPAERPLRNGLNIEKAAAQLGYDPVSICEGIRKTLELLAAEDLHHSRIQ